VRERIHRLEARIDDLARRRGVMRRKRTRAGVPTVAIVGYTNAGKSTLFNALTGADVLVRDLLFSTLDTTARRARLPGGTEIVLTDTVGFIAELPEDLVAAFKATLEELNEADLLVHVADASSPFVAEEIEAVEAILEDLRLGSLPRVLVLNKVDRLEPELLAERMVGIERGTPVSAFDAPSVARLAERIERALGMADGAWREPS
jgi:GTP-binding protein HflX